MNKVTITVYNNSFHGGNGWAYIDKLQEELDFLLKEKQEYEEVSKGVIE